VSLNPIVHADLFGTIIFPIIGLMNGMMFGWAKPTPVNISRLRNPRRDHMLVAAAGPISNFTMAMVLFVLLMTLKAVSADGASLVRDIADNPFSTPQGGNTILSPLVLVAFHGIYLNLILAVFNLIPVAPLDGAAVLTGLLPRSMVGIMEKIQPYGFMILMAMMLLGITTMLFEPVLIFFIQFLRV
jgi:Zn-dependent protease